MKEFLTIGELADIFNMDVQLLRHYDAKGLLVPQVRNSENNRRFYHFDQVYPLATIRYLRRLDYSLAQIKAFLHSNGLRDNLQMLSQQAQQLRRQCDELNATIQIIQQKVEFIEGSRPPANGINSMSAPSRAGPFCTSARKSTSLPMSCFTSIPPWAFIRDSGNGSAPTSMKILPPRPAACRT